MSYDIKTRTDAVRLIASTVLYETAKRVGHCPPAFFLLGKSGELHYGPMQLYDRDAQLTRLWIIAASCDVGALVATSSVMIDGMEPVKCAHVRMEVLHKTHLQRPLLGESELLRVGIANMPVKSTGFSVEGIMGSIQWGLKDDYYPGYNSPGDLPPIFRSHSPSISSFLGSRLRSELTDVSALHESAFRDSVDEALKRYLDV